MDEINSKIRLKETSACTLEGIVAACQEELERRKGWPTRLVFVVPGEMGNERFYDLDEALAAFRRRVIHDMDYKKDWKFACNCQLGWFREEYDPQPQAPAAVPAPTPPAEETP